MSQVSASQEKKADGPSQAALVARMLALAWRYRFGCLKVIAQQTALVMLGLIGLSLTGLGIDYIAYAVDASHSAPRWPWGFAPATDARPLAVVAVIAGAILGASLVQTGLRYAAALTVARLTQRVVVQLRADVYDKLQRLSFRFFDSQESGSIINRVTGDVQAVRMFIDGVIIQALVVALSLAVFLVYMLRIHVGLTLACLATTPLLWVASAMFARRVQPAYVRNRELVDKLVLNLSENVQGAIVVKGFAREDAEVARFAAANDRVLEGKHDVFWKLSIYQPIVGFLTQWNVLVLIGYGGALALRGEVPLGEGLFVFANLLQQFATQVSQIANIGNSIQTSITGARRVFEVLDAPVEIRDPPQPVPLRKARGGVRFDHVTFGYQADEPILHDIQLDIAPGECVAIVGATGAGKSTLAHLVPRFYDPTAGRVLLDGTDVRKFSLDDLRRNVGLVFQESFLFSNTVAANIAFGVPDAASGDIARAAQLASADEFITELPHGYQTIIGEYGSNLSGGQRQRLAIARALLTDPAVLILDDPTTAVDPETEHEMLSSWRDAKAGRTTLLIAHRLSTLRLADRIAVLENGRVAQIGTHDELMNRSGHYRDSAWEQLAQASSAPTIQRGVA